MRHRPCRRLTYLQACSPGLLPLSVALDLPFVAIALPCYPLAPRNPSQLASALVPWSFHPHPGSLSGHLPGRGETHLPLWPMTLLLLGHVLPLWMGILVGLSGVVAQSHIGCSWPPLELPLPWCDLRCPAHHWRSVCRLHTSGLSLGSPQRLLVAPELLASLCLPQATLPPD